MATFQPYVGEATHTGSKEKIEYPPMIWAKVGEGTVTQFDKFDLSFLGSVNIPHIIETKFDISVILTDKNSSATKGPCTVKVQIGDNDPMEDDNARYHVDDGKLVIIAYFEDHTETIKMYRTGRKHDYTMLEFKPPFYQVIGKVRLAPE